MSDIPKGYKQTEVGVIPEDWKVTQLTAIADVRDGTHESPKYTKTGVPFVTSKNILGGRVDFEDITFISEDDAKAVNKRSKVDVDDILLSMIGTVGNAALVDFDPKFCIKNVALIKPEASQIESRFLIQVIRSDSYGSYIDNKLDGGIQKFISLGMLRGLEVPLPPTKTEQEAIAGALGDADALIESLEQLIAKKHLVKQGAMQELLCPKKNWVEKRLGKTATLKARIGWQGLTTAEYLDSGDYFLVTGTDFKAGYIDWENCNCVAAARYVQDRNIQLKEHDVLVTKDGTIGKVALITRLPKPATLNSGVFVIRPVGNAFDPDFFYYLLCSQVFAEFLSQLCAGSTINHLYQKDFVHFVYKTPETVAEQSAIAGVLSDMDAEIEALEARLAKARLVKQGMMQELLTGRVRLV